MQKILQMIRPLRRVGLLIVLSATIGSLMLPGAALAAPLAGMQGPGNCRWIHNIQYGQTLASISSFYGVGVYALMQANRIDNPNWIYAGQRLCIPDGMRPGPGDNNGYPPPRPMPGGFYAVQPGDTLASIAWRYGVDVPFLMRLNGLTDPNCLEVGQVLRVSAGGGGMPDQPGPPERPTPQPPVVEPPPIMNDWHAAYFNNNRLEGSPVFERNDGDINFDWGTGGPGNGVGDDNFSVRWTRDTYFAAGNYRFFATVDDGLRLYVDNKLIIDAWRVQPATSYYGDIHLDSGNHTVRVEYSEDAGGALIRLTWDRF